MLQNPDPVNPFFKASDGGFVDRHERYVKFTLSEFRQTNQMG